MNETTATTATWKIEPKHRSQGHGQPSRRFNLLIEVTSLHRPQHVYEWSADVFISDTGHTDINDVVLRAIRGGHTNLVPQDIRKHFAFPQKGISHVEPEDLESACQALADTHFAKTQVAELRFLNQDKMNEDNIQRVQRSQDAIKAIADR